MFKSEDASVIFTSSGVGRRGKAYWGAYAVSKFGIEGLNQVLADELENKPGIRVNAVNPGPTRTAMRAAAYPAEDPMRLKTPEDILGVYLYLLGPESRGTSGASFDAQ
jgi:NAD(P)-dependent dehydrogenase (short-subunit alcohol dehydrogenase family)